MALSWAESSVDLVGEIIAVFLYTVVSPFTPAVSGVLKNFWCDHLQSRVQICPSVMKVIAQEWL